MYHPFNNSSSSTSDTYNDPYIFHNKPIVSNNPPPPATPFSFSHFSSPVFLFPEADDVFLQDPFSQQQQPFLETTSYFTDISTMAAHRNMIAQPKHNICAASSSSGESRSKALKGSSSLELADKGLKKRAPTSTTSTSKKDRHSKINTAQGPRDRRMRLSLDIARRFFGLQDILGFDKASKTVEWLLNKSKSDIQKLKMDDSSSPSSECAEVSGLDDDAALVNYEDQQREITMTGISDNKPSPDNKEKKKTRPVSSSSQRKVTLDINGAKELRAKARERARERTKDKMRCLGSLDESRPNSSSENNTNLELTTTTTQMTSSCSWNVPFSSLTMNPSSSLDALAQMGKQVSSFEVNDRLSLSQFNKFNYPHNWGNFQANPCGDFALHNKFWEASTSNDSTLL